MAELWNPQAEDNDAAVTRSAPGKLSGKGSRMEDPVAHPNGDPHQGRLPDGTDPAATLGSSSTRRLVGLHLSLAGTVFPDSRLGEDAGASPGGAGKSTGHTDAGKTQTK